MQCLTLLDYGKSPLHSFVLAHLNPAREIRSHKSLCRAIHIKEVHNAFALSRVRVANVSRVDSPLLHCLSTHRMSSSFESCMRVASRRAQSALLSVAISLPRLLSLSTAQSFPTQALLLARYAPSRCEGSSVTLLGIEGSVPATRQERVRVLLPFRQLRPAQ